MKALLIQSLLLLLATVAHASLPETHDLVVDGKVLVAATAKQRNFLVSLGGQNGLSRERMYRANAFRYCAQHNYARVAEDSQGRLLYKVATKMPQEMATDASLMMWTADGMQSASLAQVSRWTTKNDNGHMKFEASGPFEIFTRLRCADPIE